MKSVLLIMLLGSLGVLTRYLIDQKLAPNQGSAFPLSTFSINIAGSVLIGFLFVLCNEKALIQKELGLALMTGFLGGFTTFSAYSLQSLFLIQEGHIQIALLYFISSPLIGILGAWLGILTGRLI